MENNQPLFSNSGIFADSRCIALQHPGELDVVALVTDMLSEGGTNVMCTSSSNLVSNSYIPVFGGTG